MKKTSLLHGLALMLFMLLCVFPATAVNSVPRIPKPHPAITLRQFSESPNADLEKLLGKKPGWKERLAYGLLKKRLRKVIRENAALGDLPFNFPPSCSKISLYDGTVIEADIVRISSTRVVYKRCGNPDAPEIDIAKNDVVSIEGPDGKIIYRSREETDTYGEPETEKLAPWALTCAIAGLFFFPFAIAGLIFGLISLGRIDREPGRYKGRGMAIAGIIVGGIFVIAVLLVLSLFISGA